MSSTIGIRLRTPWQKRRGEEMVRAVFPVDNLYTQRFTFPEHEDVIVYLRVNSSLSKLEWAGWLKLEQSLRDVVTITPTSIGGRKALQGIVKHLQERTHG